MWSILKDYFDYEARQKLVLLAQNSEMSLFDQNGEIIKSSNKQDDPYAVPNKTLAKKMNALAWLSCAQKFVDPRLSLQMLQAFRQSEVPFENLDKRRHYMTQVTTSHAIEVVISCIDKFIETRKKIREDGIAALSNSELSQNDFQNILIPMKILQLLVCNVQQASLGIDSMNLVGHLSTLLQELGGKIMPIYLRGAEQSTVKEIARILASLMFRPEA